MKHLTSFPTYIQDRLKRHPGIAKILNNIGWLAIDKVMRIIIGLLVGAWVARFLGPSHFGELAYTIAFVSLFQTVAQLGLDNIAIRDIARQPLFAKEILETIFRLRILSGFLCYFAAILLMYFLRGNDEKALLLVSIVAGIIVFQSSDTADIWFQSELQSKKTVLAKFFSYSLTNIIRIALVLSNSSLIAFALVILLEAVLSALALLYSYRQYQPGGYLGFSKHRCKSLLFEGAPFLFSGIILTAYMMLDRVLLGALMGASEVGYYVAAASLSSAFNFVPMIIGMSLAPKMSAINSESERQVFFIKFSSILIWMSFFVSTVLFFSANFLMDLLYGDSFDNSSLTLKILAFSMIPIFLSVANDYMALNANRGKVSLLRAIAGFFVNLLLNMVLIPRYGAIGAAISATAAHWFSNTLFYWLIFRKSFYVQIMAVALPFRLIYLQYFWQRTS